MVAPEISANQIRSVVAGLLGGDVAGVTRLPGSVANQDFVVDCLAGPRLVLKAGPEAEIAAEAWACARLGDLGVPVPRVIASERLPSQLGSPFLLAEFVPGEPTSDLDVVRDAGAWFRRVHEVELPGWGPLQVEVEGAQPPAAGGRHPSWRDAVDADLAGLPELVEAGIVGEGLAAAAFRLVDPLDYDGPGVLLHNDLKPAHLFGLLERGRRRLSAVIDWGDASVGDPAAEIARLSMSGPAATAAFLDGYGMRLTDELAGRLRRYRVLWNVRALSYEYRAGGDWFHAYRDRISEDTSRWLG